MIFFFSELLLFLRILESVKLHLSLFCFGMLHSFTINHKSKLNESVVLEFYFNRFFCFSGLEGVVHPLRRGEVR